MENTIKLNNGNFLEVGIYQNNDIADCYIDYMLEKYDIYSRKSNLSDQGLEDLYHELMEDITLGKYIEHSKLDIYELHELIEALHDDIDAYDYDDLSALTLADIFYNFDGVEQLTDIFYNYDGIKILNKMLSSKHLVGYEYTNYNEWDHFYFVLDENQAKNMEEFDQDLNDFQAALSGDSCTIIAQELDSNGATIMEEEQYDILSNDIYKDIENIIKNYNNGTVPKNYNAYDITINY